MQIGDLKTKIICYITDIDTSYNLLLENLIVLSTLHQCIKYIDDEGNVKTLIKEKQLFKGLKIIS